jgi:uncharacterized protein (TIGR00369 family)
VPSDVEPAKITADQFLDLIRATIPQSTEMPFRVLELSAGRAVLELAFSETQLRAGGSLSGPTMFTLADTALYAAVLSRIGLVPLAVTTDVSIHFVKKPRAGLRAEAELLRCGRSLAVGTVKLTSEGEVVAHATGTYALPG